MFPWVYGFTWDAGNIIFLSIFFSVVIVILTALATASICASRKMTARQVDELKWHDEFNDLSDRARICRHVLTGEITNRKCPNGFDCRVCDLHPSLAAERAVSHASITGVGPGESKIFGLNMPQDRMYHRGHAWVKCESDGMLSVGLDDFGKKILGNPDSVELPEIGTELEVNGTGWHLEKAGARIRILSPVDGKVVATGGDEDSYYLKVKPDGIADLRHLLKGCEIRPWILREIERLEAAFANEKVGSSLADGGELMNDLPREYPGINWDSVLGEMFLEP
ncbi:MAG TPA: glycine cleavage system protein H [Candidatus Kryptonia bacterium]